MGRLRAALGIAAIVLTLTACQDQKPPKMENVAEKNFDATTKVEYKLSMGENYISGKHLDFLAKKRGAYLVEGWKSAYRDNDKLDRMFSFEVTNFFALPFKKSFDFSREVYRVEITYSDGRIIERTTVNFPRY